MIGIWGAGAEGMAAARELRAEDVLVVDEFKASRPAGLPGAARFASGAAALEQLLACSEVILSPGVPRTHPFCARLATAGIATSSLTARWLNAAGRTTLGVTGTKGKSTTATLLSLLLESAGIDVQLGGNIGVPLTNLRPSAAATVAELSSYQCASISTAPRLAVITSLYEDHLTWHGSKHAYWQDKAKILGAGCEVLVCDAPTLTKLRSIGTMLPGRVLIPDASTFCLSTAELPRALQLEQNLHNLQLAVSAANAWLARPLSKREILAAVARFQPLPHRLELVAERAGVSWFDDTLSTVPESVIAASVALSGELTLIVGGEDRGLDYTPLTNHLLHRTPLATLITIPSSGARISAAYEQCHPERVHHVETLTEAVALAVSIARPDSAVVLSPGAPSYDFYKNFEHKSAAFAAAIGEFTTGELVR